MIKIMLLFAAGGFLYGAVEVVHRGFTHISMFIVGGICLVLIGQLGQTKRDIPVTMRMLISAVIITTLELVSGLIVNVWLNLDVWDYSDTPYNFMGQICLHASSIWVYLSLPGIYADRFMRKKLFGEKLRKMRFLP